MRRLIFWAVALALALPIVASAQAPREVVRFTIMSAYDLDGEAADDDQVVVVGNGALTDSKTFTITAQPDVCRLLDITVTDADSSITAGTLTVAGTGCLGEAKSCSFTFAAGGSGVKTLTCVNGQGAYLKAVTSVTTGVLTGEGGGDTVIVGYTTGTANGWAMYGRVAPRGPNGEGRVDPTGAFDVGVRVTTSDVPSTTVAAVTASSNPYAQVAVGDLLLFQVGGVSYERKVTARASADSVTVSSTITLPAAGVTFRFKRMYFSRNPLDVLAVPVSGYQTMLLDWSVDANANTGGVVTSLECTQERVEFPGASRWVELSTTTVASAGTKANTSESINLNLLPYSYCRFGLKFGTGDDADAADEDINASVSLMK